jgi:23S rRNA pseudouridine1911/1915/1917 synthase
MNTPQIIFEDQSLMVVEKPTHLVVNEAVTVKDKLTLQSWLSKLDYPLARVWELRNGIVHRLDRDTSGLLVVAKTEKAMNFLQAEFKNRHVKKEYLALVHGRLKPEEGSIEVPVGRLPWNRQRFGILPSGRDSKTNYKVLGYYEANGDNFSLVQLKPLTGRTHQIRIHMKYLGHPIVSDDFYAGRKTARRDKKLFPRLFLHAARLSFKHPETQKLLTFESKLPEDLSLALRALQKHL